ncbi:hypothetical protein [Actinomadura napierensis]|uniref:Tetratricopeptide repeat protein n=1 Tax=Actinomadura napierensis TaxID=267854 RepID=A0ABN2YBZ3_9ACTN
MLSEDGEVARLHHLATSGEGSATPEIAHAALGLGRALERAGRYWPALLLIEDAVTLFQELDSAGSGLFQYGLAAALAARSRCLRAAGRPQEALASSAEALAIQERLAVGDPADNPELLRDTRRLINESLAQPRDEGKAQS